MLFEKYTAPKRIALSLLFTFAITLVYELVLGKKEFVDALTFAIFFAIVLAFISEVMIAYKRDELSKKTPTNN